MASATYVVGQKVQVWSNKMGGWVAEGIVLHAPRSDETIEGFAVRAGAVKVQHRLGTKWIMPDKIPTQLRPQSAGYPAKGAASPVPMPAAAAAPPGSGRPNAGAFRQQGPLRAARTALRPGGSPTRREAAARSRPAEVVTRGARPREALVEKVKTTAQLPLEQQKQKLLEQQKALDQQQQLLEQQRQEGLKEVEQHKELLQKQLLEQLEQQRQQQQQAQEQQQQLQQHAARALEQQKQQLLEQQKALDQQLQQQMQAQEQLRQQQQHAQEQQQRLQQQLLEQQQALEQQRQQQQEQAQEQQEQLQQQLLMQQRSLEQQRQLFEQQKSQRSPPQQQTPEQEQLLQPAAPSPLPAPAPPLSPPVLPPPAAAAEKHGGGVWTLECSHFIGATMGDFEGKVPLLEIKSTKQAVAQLTDGSIQCAEGSCLVFSESQSAYFLLFRSDLQEIIFETHGLRPPETNPGAEEKPASAPATTWSKDFSHKIGSYLGQYEGKEMQLDRAAYTSVSQAATDLAAGRVSCEAGVCIVYSEGQGSFYLLYRSDMRDTILERYGLRDDTQRS